MFAIKLGVRGLAHTRFAISPLQEICGLLELVARPELTVPTQRAALARTRSALGDGRLELIAALAAPGYLPDMLTPHPDGDGDLTAELRTVRATPPARVRAEVAAIRDGRPRAGMAARDLPPVVAAALDRGPTTFAARAADELETLWDLVLADRWGTIRAALAADIARRGEQFAVEGAAALLAGLHPDVHWDDDADLLTIEARYTARVECDDTLVLVPSAVRCTPNVLIDPCHGDRRPPVICYPIDAAFRPDEGVARPSADLLGSTRARLLADLAVARTTTDLAARHHLTPSSVSYHLGVLHRAGLATRERAGARVLYRRTSRADTLLVAGAGG